MLEQTDRFILKSAYEVEKGKIKKPSTEPTRGNSKNSEAKLIKNKTPHNWPLIIEILDTSSDSEQEKIPKKL